MELESLTCNNCGGPLEVPSGVDHIRCNHCQSQLVVRRAASVTYTELIQQVADRTEQLTDHVVRLTYENELNRLDQEWEKERDSLMVHSKNGRKSEPSGSSALLIAIMSIVGGLIATTQAGPIGILFMGIGLVVSGVMYLNALAFREAENRHRLRRNRLTLESVRKRIIAESQETPSTSTSPNHTPPQYPNLPQ
ncbi:MAG: hypothetical protein R3C01_03285 [Planctomycetaceae bacterium]